MFSKRIAHECPRDFSNKGLQLLPVACPSPAIAGFYWPSLSASHQDVAIHVDTWYSLCMAASTCTRFNGIWCSVSFKMCRFVLHPSPNHRQAKQKTKEGPLPKHFNHHCHPNHFNYHHVSTLHHSTVYWCLGNFGPPFVSAIPWSWSLLALHAPAPPHVWSVHRLTAAGWKWQEWPGSDL